MMISKPPKYVFRIILKFMKVYSFENIKSHENSKSIILVHEELINLHIVIVVNK